MGSGLSPAKETSFKLRLHREIVGYPSSASRHLEDQRVNRQSRSPSSESRPSNSIPIPTSLDLGSWTSRAVNTALAKRDQELSAFAGDNNQDRGLGMRPDPLSKDPPGGS